MNTTRDNEEEVLEEEVLEEEVLEEEGEIVAEEAIVEEEVLEEEEEVLEEEEEEVLGAMEEIGGGEQRNTINWDNQEREYIANQRQELRNSGIAPIDEQFPSRIRYRPSNMFSMIPPTTAPPPRGPPSNIHIPQSHIRELDYRHIFNHSPIRPHVTRRRTCCNSCDEETTLMSRKHMTCYDCLVHFLTTSKIFVQGFDITSKRDSQMCIVCLDTVKHIGSRYVICIDCLITRLGDLNLLKFTERDDIHPLYVAIDTSYETGSVDWQRKKYFPCDICLRDNIEDTRTERVCMDCLMDKLLDSPYFTKVKRRIYS